MKDYFVKISVKNNILLTAMRKAGLDTAAALSRATGVHQATIGRFLNLKIAPFGKNGFVPSILKISKVLRTLPEDLFPPQHLEKVLEKNTATVEMSMPDVEHMISYAQDPGKLFEIKEMRGKLILMLATVSPREEKILRSRFGFDGPCKTLEECAEMFGITGNRVRQIEGRALRMLRHPIRSKLLGDYGPFPQPEREELSFD